MSQKVRLLVLWVFAFYGLIAAAVEFSIGEVISDPVVRTMAQGATSAAVNLQTAGSGGERRVSLTSCSVRSNAFLRIRNRRTAKAVDLRGFPEGCREIRVTPYLLAELKAQGLGEGDQLDCELFEGTSSGHRVLEQFTVSSPAVRLPRFMYGRRGSLQEASGVERRLKDVSLSVPTLIFEPGISETRQRELGQEAVRMAVYAYRYELPDGTEAEHLDFGDDVALSAADLAVTKLNYSSFEIWNSSGTLSSYTVRQFSASELTPLEKACKIWSAALSVRQSVSIYVGMASLPNGVLGSSFQPAHYYDEGRGYSFPVALQDQIKGADVDKSTADIRLLFSSNFNFYLGTDGKGASSKHDLLTVLLHEICHGLGFTSIHLRRQAYDGSVSIDGSYANGHPAAFDWFLSHGGIRLPKMASNSDRKVAFVSGDLWWDGEGGRAANGGNRVKMFAPTKYENGSSVSHWDNSVTFSTFMKKAIASGVHCHEVDERILGVFKDIGWTMAGSSYGIAITFNPNGGSVSPSKKEYGEGSTYGSMPVPTRTGYSFDGWYTAKDGGSLIGTGNKVPTEATEVFAHWTPNAYSVVFDRNGGTGTAMANQNLVYGRAAKLNACTYSKSGYRFLGWAKLKNAVSPDWKDGEEVVNLTSEKGGKVTLFAVWKLKPKTVSIQLSGPADVTSGDRVKLICTAQFDDNTSEVVLPTWKPRVNPVSISVDGGGVFVAPYVQTRTSVTVMCEYDGKTASAAIAISPLVVTVTFDPTGGSVSPARSDFTVGATYGTLPRPASSAAGVFAGWFDARNGGSQITEATEVSADRFVLYAHWRTATPGIAVNEGDTGALTLVTGGQNPWQVQGDVVSEGDLALVSGKVSGTGESWVRTTVTGPGTISWDWRVGNAMSQIDFLIDGSSSRTCIGISTFTGGVDPTKSWVTYNQFVPAGTHELTWSVCNANNRLSSLLAVRGYLDRIVWTPGARAPDPVSDRITVTFEPDGGIVSETARTYAAGEVYGDLPLPYRPGGWTFAGWYTPDGVQATSAGRVPARDVTLTARWQSETVVVRVSFDAAGGTLPEGSLSYSVGSAYGTFPRPVREGYDFLGWFTPGGDEITAEMQVKAEITTLVAHWIKRPGSGPEPSDEVFYNLVIKDCYLSSDKSGLVPAEAFGRGDPIYLNFTIGEENGAAIPEPCKILFSCGGNTLSYSRQGLGEGEDFTVRGGVWQTLQNRPAGYCGISVWADPDHEVAETDVFDNFCDLGFTVVQAAARQVTVTFNANGGSAVAARTYALGEPYGSLPTPTKTGAQFLGWYTAATGGSEVLAEDVVAGGVTLYAHWHVASAANEFRLVFHANGGTGSMPDMFFRTGVAQKLSRNAYVNGSLKFLGWARLAGAKTAEFSDQAIVGFSSDNPDEVFHLYAVWTDGPDFGAAFGEFRIFDGCRGWTDGVDPDSRYNAVVQSEGTDGLFSTTLQGPGTLSFRWRRTSSAVRLSLVVDGSVRWSSPASGSIGRWEKVSLDLEASAHTVNWVHSSDGKAVVAVDDVSWRGPVITKFEVTGPRAAFYGSPIDVKCLATYDNGFQSPIVPSWAFSCFDTQQGRTIAFPASLSRRILDDGRIVIGSCEEERGRLSVMPQPEYRLDSGSWSIDLATIDLLPFSKVFTFGYANGEATIAEQRGSFMDDEYYLALQIHEVTLPSRMGGCPVVAVGDEVFKYGSLNFTRIEIPQPVRRIGKAAFANCGGLASVRLPATLREMSADAFGSRIGGIRFELEDGNPYFSLENGVLIGNDGRTLFRVSPEGCGETFEVPAGIEEIAPYAFAGCRNLKSILFDGAAPTVGRNAFADCENAVAYYRADRDGWGSALGDLRTEVRKVWVNFDACGGRVDVGFGDFAVGGDWTGLPEPTREGFVFVGWRLTRDSGAPLSGTAVVPVTQDEITLYAIWRGEPFDVLFRDDDGTPMGSSVCYRGEGQILPGPDAIRQGHSFVGWAESIGGEPLWKAGDDMDGLRPGKDGIALYAVWSANAYVLRYDANGGKGEMEDQGFTYGVVQGLRTGTFTRTGYSFAGWSLTPLADRADFADRAEVCDLTSAAGGSVTLYAFWTPQSYAVRLRNDDRSDPGDPVEVVFGTGMSAAVPEGLEGYSFAGYFDDAGVMYVAPDGNSARDWDKAAPCVLTAHWTGNIWYANFNPCVAEAGSMARQAFVYGTMSALRGNQFVRRGFTFVGWSRSEGGVVAFKDCEEVDSLTATSGGVVELYAVWAPNRYAVVFDPNGGTGKMDPQELEFGTPVRLGKNVFVRTGYSFAGWKLPGDVGIVEDGAEVLDLTEECDGKVILEAVWEPIRYRILFEANGGDGIAAGQEAEFDGGAPLMPNVFHRNGYSFAGWSLQPEGEVVYGEGVVPGNLCTEAGDEIRLFAQWKAKAYRIKFDLNGGKTKLADVELTFHSLYVLPEAPERDGYAFLGWWTEKSAGERITEESHLLIASDHTLYAHWEKTFRLTVRGGVSVSDDGAPAASVKRWIPGSDTARLVAEDRSASGQVFAYWLVSPATAVLGDAFDAVSPETGFVMPAADWTAEAVYIANPSYVRVDLDEVNATDNESSEPKGIEWSADGKGWYAANDGNFRPVRPGTAVKIQFRSRDARWLSPNALQCEVRAGERRTVGGVATRISVVSADTLHFFVNSADVSQADELSHGTVSVSPASGQVLSGKDVTIKAVPYPGRVFVDWTDGNNVRVGMSATMKVAPSRDTSYTARFRLKEDCAKPVFDPYVRSANAMVGVDYEGLAVVNDEALPVAFTAASLPAGLKMDKDSGTVVGIPTKAGSATAKFTAKSAANPSWSDVQSAEIEIAPLPDWVQGTYSGDGMMTVSAAGKVDGKFATGPTNWTFSAKSFSVSSRSADGFFVIEADAKGTVRSGTKTVTLVAPLRLELVAGGQTAACAVGSVRVDGREFEIAYARDAGAVLSSSSEGSGTGTVSANPKYGQAAAGKTVTLTAKADAKSVFVRWIVTDAQGNRLFEDGSQYGATLKYVADGSGDVFAEAVFRSKAETPTKPELSWDDAAFSSLRVGVKFDAAVSVDDSARPVKFTAKDLPAGLKLDATTGRIAGVPTKASDKPFAITATSTLDKNCTVKDVPFDYAVAALPQEAVGTFSGLAQTKIREDGMDTRWGSASLTVSAAGKISGKVIVNGTNGTFTAASYDSFGKGTDEAGWRASATCSLKIGKQTRPMKLNVAPGGASVEEDDLSVGFFRDSWKDKGADPVPEEYQGTYSAKLASDVFRTGYLSLTVGKDGKVKVAGKAPDGTAISATAMLVPAVDLDGKAYYFADVFAALSAYNGGYLAGTIDFYDDRTLSGYMEWRSYNPQSTGNYGDGDFDLALDCSGAKYDSTASLKDGYDKLKLSAPGIGEELFVAVDTTGKKFVVPDKGNAKLTFSFTQPTGIWKGSYLMWPDPSSAKSVTVSFEGILVQGEADLKGFGTYDATSFYPTYDRTGKKTGEMAYKYKESIPVDFINGNKDM